MHYQSHEDIRTVLNANDMFSSAATIHEYRSKHPLGTCVLNILVEMHKYMPGAEWLSPHAGQGMVNKTVEAAWKMCSQPADVGRDHVIKVYFPAGETNLSDQFG